jgi:hypothetical protein
MKRQEVIQFFLNKEQMNEVLRRSNYHRITANEWAKSRILTILKVKDVS